MLFRRMSKSLVREESVHTLFYPYLCNLIACATITSTNSDLDVTVI
jgi:hypothetical protein